MPKSLALLTPRLIGGVTSPGDAVAPAQTIPMRATAAKRERGSGGFSRGGPNASRWFRPPSLAYWYPESQVAETPPLNAALVDFRFCPLEWFGGFIVALDEVADALHQLLNGRERGVSE